jgi:hypothetical protein
VAITSTFSVINALTYLFSKLDTIKGRWTSPLTSAQTYLLNSYCASLKVKRVILNDSPDPATGVSLVPSTAGPAWGGTGDAQDIVLSDLGISIASSAGLIVDGNSTFSSAGLYHFNGKISDPTKATALAYYQPFSKSFPSQTVAAANYTLSSGVQQLSFYSTFASWSGTSKALGDIWLKWVTNGAVPSKSVTFDVLTDASVNQKILVITLGIFYILSYVLISHSYFSC